MSHKLNSEIAVIGIDIGKNSFHVVGCDDRGTIMLRQKCAELPRILARPCDALSPRMLRVIEDLAGDWRRLDERIEGLSSEIEVLACQDVGCERLMSVPGIGPISRAHCPCLAADVVASGRAYDGSDATFSPAPAKSGEGERPAGADLRPASARR
jgi:hypothetical protein